MSYSSKVRKSSKYEYGSHRADNGPRGGGFARARAPCAQRPGPAAHRRDARRGGELSCGGFDVPVTKSTCTHHFRVLREAGVISQRQVGTTRLNGLRRADLDSRFPGLLETILRAAAADGA